MEKLFTAGLDNTRLQCRIEILVFTSRSCNCMSDMHVYLIYKRLRYIYIYIYIIRNFTSTEYDTLLSLTFKYVVRNFDFLVQFLSFMWQLRSTLLYLCENEDKAHISTMLMKPIYLFLRGPATKQNGQLQNKDSHVML